MGPAVRLAFLKRCVRHHGTAFGQFRHNVEYRGYLPLSVAHAHADSLDEITFTLMSPQADSTNGFTHDSHKLKCFDTGSES